MNFTYREQQYTFPNSLADITLRQRIDFYNLHGKDIDAKAVLIEKIKDDTEKEIERNILSIDLACKSFSFYTGIPIHEVQQFMSVEDIMEIYAVDMQMLQDQERSIVLQPTYDWRGEQWCIAAPEVTGNSSMTLIEFVTGKEVVRQLSAVGKGKWDALPYLCAIYLRKRLPDGTQEPFTESLVAANSERLAAMYDLPMDIAIAVGFFLSSTLSIYITTFLSSPKEGEKEE